MNRGAGALTFSLILVGGLALAPAAAIAARSHGGGTGGHVSGGGRSVGVARGGGHHFTPSMVGRGGHHVAPRTIGGGFHHVGSRHGVPHRVVPRAFGRPFVPFGVVATPFVYAPWSGLYPAPLSYDPAGYYDPSFGYGTPVGYGPPAGGTISVSPYVPPSPMPTVVEYPTGRYELRGDGITTPYNWVWIPNLPPPPSTSPLPEEPSAGDRSPVRHGQLYRWTDEQGVAHWTDRWESVPPEYRAEATQSRPR